MHLKNLIMKNTIIELMKNMDEMEVNIKYFTMQIS